MTVGDAWIFLKPWSAAKSEAAPRRLLAGAEVEERVAVLLGLEGLHDLEAEISLRPWLDGLEMSGWVKGVALRLCGLTLEPLEESVDEAVLVRLLPEGSPNAPLSVGQEVVIDLEADDPPEMVTGDVINLGAYLVEAFGLGLEPFPRKTGAVFEAPETGAALSPFAVLKALRPGVGNGGS